MILFCENTDSNHSEGMELCVHFSSLPVILLTAINSNPLGILPWASPNAGKGLKLKKSWEMIPTIDTTQEICRKKTSEEKVFSMLFTFHSYHTGDAEELSGENLLDDENYKSTDCTHIHCTCQK